MSSTCIPTAAVVADISSTAAAATAVASAATSSSLSLCRNRRHSFSNVVFPLSFNPNLPRFSQSSRSSYTHVITAKSQLNNAGFGGSSTGAAHSKSEAPAKEVKNGKPSSESVPTQLASDDSISEFITQVVSLVKLVDSRDIVELEMKQHDCELLIRKKEAISKISPQPVPTMQAPPTPPAPPQASLPASTSLAAPASSPAPTPPAAKPAKSSVPPLKSPMAGTFYRSPAPGAPTFVKVGDKVQKGQIVCIIEAMKLMNEIEADQTGTVVEIIAEDGKPVSLDTPLVKSALIETFHTTVSAASLPDEFTNISTTIGSFWNHSRVLSFNPCSVAYPVAKNEYRYHKKNLSQGLEFYEGNNNVQLPVVFDWAIGSVNCSVSQANKSCLCKSNTLGS